MTLPYCISLLRLQSLSVSVCTKYKEPYFNGSCPEKVCMKFGEGGGLSS